MKLQDFKFFKFTRNFYRNEKPLIALLIAIAILLWDIFPWSDNHGIDHATKHFKEHFWLEILSGLLLWVLLEAKFREFGLMPRKTQKRNYVTIMNSITESKRSVEILDNEFSSFYDEKVDFENKLRKTLAKLTEIDSFKILLLHPHTHTAIQRNKDIQSIDGINEHDPVYEKELFDLIHDSLDSLQQTIENIKKADEKEKDINKRLGPKLKVKLFQTSHSVSFISWDKNINFGIIPPNSSTDDSCFDMVNETPLADYLHKNFNAIWKDNKTISLEEYKYVIVETQDGKEYKFYWGVDSFNPETPSFLALHPEQNHKFKFSTSLAENSTVKIIHNNEFQWASIYEIYRETPNVIPTLEEFAKNQIEDNYKSISNLKLVKVYQIVYDHKHRITLKDGNYVKEQLDRKGYAYVPHTKFNIFLGFRVKKMLNSLYGFFDAKNFNSILKPEHNIKAKPKRIVAQFICKVRDSKITVKPEIENIHPAIAKYTNLLTNADKDVHQIIPVINSTIKADITRILGNRFRKQNHQKYSEDFRVFVHLIQVEVNLDFSLADPQNDDYNESSAYYTVTHMAGKRNILGGINKLIIKTTDSKKTLEYNLNNTLDSFYFTREHMKDHKTHIHKLKSGKIQFSGVNNETQEDKLTGYRNIFAIEFFKMNT